MHACMHVRVCMYMPGHTCVHKILHMHMYVYVCMYACVCVTASTAMAVPVFSQKNHSKTIALNTQKRHRYTFIVQYDIIITTFPHNRLARICSDIAAVSVLVVCI